MSIVHEFRSTDLFVISPDVDDDKRVFGDKVTFEEVILHDAMRSTCQGTWLKKIYPKIIKIWVPTDWSHAVPSEHFLREGCGVRQIREILERGKSISSNDAVYLFLSLSLDFRMEHHGEEKGIYGGDGLGKLESLGRPYDHHRRTVSAPPGHPNVKHNSAAVNLVRCTSV